MGIRSMATRVLDALPLRPGVFTQNLPADAYTESLTDLQASERLLRVSRPVYNAAYSYVIPEKCPEPRVLAVSSGAAETIELDAQQDDEFVQVFSGNKVLRDTRPWAQCYGGHQFGFFAGQLGDGRAISLFETETSKGDRWELQLKGAGRTPYARNGDGYAVLRSSVREFLMSEHMHALGVPTTRALALVLTSRDVFRDDALPNEPQPERGAVVTRMAPSWVRFGSFEIFYSRGDMDMVKKLADYVIENVYAFDTNQGDENKYARLVRTVARRTAKMVAEWQAIDFNHGVMNTDNMSILGLTLDYGPYEIMDFYTPTNICNHSDETGQYAFRRQPTVAIFNLFKFAVTLFELIGAKDKVDTLIFPPSKNTEGEERPNVTDDDTRQVYREAGKAWAAQLLQNEFSDWFMQDLLTKMRQKLGLQAETANAASDMNDVIIPLLDWLSEFDVDYHRFYRSLSNYRVTGDGEERDAETAALDVIPRDGARTDECKKSLKPWLAIYRHRLLAQGTKDTDADNDTRQRHMDAVNPRFILRNWIAQQVVDNFDKMEEDEAKSVLEACLYACTHPFESHYEDQRIEDWANQPVPEWGRDLKCSCSS
ncbi:UPF0061-domain-containing protein [Lichtheimia hyalospora FSU 10163]|nr:UPF0061-domain-containing protein [Lichtheimia hyalospora FSU 10163]